MMNQRDEYSPEFKALVKGNENALRVLKDEIVSNLGQVEGDSHFAGLLLATWCKHQKERALKAGLTHKQFVEQAGAVLGTCVGTYFQLSEQDFFIQQTEGQYEN